MCLNQRQETANCDEGCLVRKAKAGNDEAFGELVRLHQARLRAFAARYLDEANDVYDVVQDAFIDAYTHLDRFDVDRDFGPWLRTICKNRILNLYRSRRTRRNISMSMVDEAIAAHVEADDRPDDGLVERLEALRHCLDGLKESQRRLIEQRYRDRVPLKDIAASMNQSAAGLAMRLYRIRGLLRKCMLRRLAAQRPGGLAAGGP